MSIDFGNDIYEEPIVAKTFLQEDAQEGSLRPKTLREYIGQKQDHCQDLHTHFTIFFRLWRMISSRDRFSTSTPFRAWDTSALV